MDFPINDSHLAAVLLREHLETIEACAKWEASARTAADIITRLQAEVDTLTEELAAEPEMEA
jgi:FtsZ-binding cell division protein ZapB